MNIVAIITNAVILINTLNYTWNRLQKR